MKSEMKRNYLDLEKELLQEMVPENMFQHILNLTNNTPYRIAGGGQDLEAAYYIKSEMEKYGLEVEMNEFETYNSYPGKGSLKIIDPVEKTIECLACLHIESTPPEGFEAEIVYVGAGGESDYIGKEVKGKIVLAEVSYSPATPEKARLAYKNGARGLVLMNWGLSSQPLIPMRGLKAVWGNPTPETWKDIPKLFAVTTTRADGEYLKNLCLKGKVKVCINTTSERKWEKVTQPIATLKGGNVSTNSEEFIIVSGHLDAWNPGVTDNASGNAVMLELARVLSKYRSSLRRNVVFCFWNGHEVAEAAGSTYYVDSKWEQINRGAVAYLNIDSPGMIDTSYLLINRSPEFSNFHGPIEERILGKQGKHLNLSKIGDQSFFGIGVPSITGRFTHADGLIEKWHGATFGWWNHTPEENLEKLDREKLELESRLWAAITLSLAQTPILPQCFTPRIDNIIAKLEETIQDKSDIFEHLYPLIPLAKRLSEYTKWLDSYANELKLTWNDRDENPTLESKKDSLNKVLIKLSRYLTFISSSATSRYEQDSYGHSDLYAPIPLLADLKKYESLSVDSVERKLLYTSLLRTRNQISDAFYYAIDEIEHLKNKNFGG